MLIDIAKILILVNTAIISVYSQNGDFYSPSSFIH